MGAVCECLPACLPARASTEPILQLFGKWATRPVDRKKEEKEQQFLFSRTQPARETEQSALPILRQHFDSSDTIDIESFPTAFIIDRTPTPTHQGQDDLEAWCSPEKYCMLHGEEACKSRVDGPRMLSNILIQEYFKPFVQ